MREQYRGWKSRLKQLILFCLNHLPFRSEITGAPKGFYRHTLEWVERNPAEHAAYTEIYPQHPVERKPPKTLDDGIDWRFTTGYLGNHFENPAAFVAIVPNGRVYGSNGIVISPDHRLLADVSIEFGVVPDNAADHSAFKKLRWSKMLHTEQTLAVLSAVCSTNYFHWMFDVLPRIHLLEKSQSFQEVDQFIVGDRLLPFQAETLAAIGIPQDKLILSNEAFHIKSARLIVPSLPGISGSVPLWACEFLRKKLLPSPSPQEASANKIYISRSNAQQRRMLNEDRLIEYLVQREFKILTMEQLSVREQAKIFATADLIIAPHGAALTNLVFCRPHTQLIEIFSPSYLNPCYRALSNLIGIDYWYLLGQGTRPGLDTANHLMAAIGEDIEVDLHQLDKILRRCLESASLP
jgi:capsular polysaccharide biosynthesis protein